MEWEERSLKETEGVVRERGGGRREGQELEVTGERVSGQKGWPAALRYREGDSGMG